MSTDGNKIDVRMKNNQQGCSQTSNEKEVKVVASKKCNKKRKDQG